MLRTCLRQERNLFGYCYHPSDRLSDDYLSCENMCVPNNKIVRNSKLKYAFSFSVSQTIAIATMYIFITSYHFPT